jgi:hypothetical protein
VFVIAFAFSPSVIHFRSLFELPRRQNHPSRTTAAGVFAIALSFQARLALIIAEPFYKVKIETLQFQSCNKTIYNFT